MHRLLARQLKSLGVGADQPPSPEQWRAFLERVNKGYCDFDQERYLLERSLIISSREMQDRWDALESQKAAAVGASQMAAIGQMAGGIAHEINTPLATIYLLSEQLQLEAGPGNAALVSLAAKIESTAHRISKIVKGLRALSRGDANEPVRKISPMAVIGDALDICREKLVSSGIQISVDVEPRAHAMGRPVQISQVLLNLIGNACDAITGTANPWIRIEARSAGDKLQVSVTDSGSGIPPGIATRIMEPFFTTKPVGKGTGLGLSVSKSIIESQAGTLELDTGSPNTKFVISLPRPANEVGLDG
ncbi:MAG TPA: ATP-binding protein [Bdellovibrionales bacterium]|nr:ATP-binding protein [Bdellovibrionales bacterium]